MEWAKKDIDFFSLFQYNQIELHSNIATELLQVFDFKMYEFNRLVLNEIQLDC